LQINYILAIGTKDHTIKNNTGLLGLYLIKNINLKLLKLQKNEIKHYMYIDYWSFSMYQISTKNQ